MKSGINPFDSQEAKPYKNDPEILAMTNLVAAYQNDDIAQFESILRVNRDNIMQDNFIREHIEGNSWEDSCHAILRVNRDKIMQDKSLKDACDVQTFKDCFFEILYFHVVQCID